MPFNKNVFINCPFDKKYNPLLRASLFCVLYLGFEPLTSRTESSSNIRVNQIKKIILSSKYGIHDLSRSKAMKKNELPRFNMPFELGLDIGCMEFKGGKFSRKKILILESQQYHYQKVLSDISGQDIKAHKDDPKTIMENVRDWFSVLSKQIIPGSDKIWIAYNQFNYDLISNLRKKQYTKSSIQNMQRGDFVKFAKDWILQFRK